MDSYRRAFGGMGYPPVATGVPPISTGVPLSARFKQIQLGGHGQGQSQSQYVQRSSGNPNYYSSPSEFQFQDSSNYGYQDPYAAHDQQMRNRMLQRQLAQSRQALEQERLRQFTGGVGVRVSPLRRKLPVQNRVGQRGGRFLRATVMQNQVSAVLPMQVNTLPRFGRGITRGRVATIRSQQSLGVARSGLAGRVGTPGVSRISGVGNSSGGIRGGRGRNIISTRGGRGNNELNGRGALGAQKTDPPSREDLDSELDMYMAKTKGYLDRELDDYMAKARAAAATTTAAVELTSTTTGTVAEPTTMET